MMTARLASALVVGLSVALLPVQADAFGGGGSTRSTSSKPAVPGAVAYGKGVKAIDKKDWQLAIFHLHKAIQANPKNADAQNWLGYSYRKVGNFESAFLHYGNALTLDPKHQGAHEYIGEAYLKTGNLKKAEEHLAMLTRLCPKGCEALEDLDEAIEKYRSGS